MDMREPPLDPPEASASYWEPDSDDVTELARDYAWEEYTTEYLDDYLDKYYPSRNDRRLFYLEALLNILWEDAEWTDGTERSYPITDNYLLWRERKAKQYGLYDDNDHKRETDAYPTCIGVIEAYWDEVIENPGDNYGGNYYEVFEDAFWESLCSYLENNNDFRGMHDDYADIVIKAHGDLEDKAYEKIKDDHNTPSDPDPWDNDHGDYDNYPN